MYAGIAYILSAIIGSVVSAASSTYNAREARHENRWLSSTAYQRAVHDLRSAGLNPALAYTSGGADSPSSPVAQGINFDQAAATARDFKMFELQTDNMSADTLLKDRSARNYLAQTELTEQTIETEKWRTEQAKHLAERYGLENFSARNTARVAATQYGQGLEYIRQLFDATSLGGNYRIGRGAYSPGPRSVYTPIGGN